MPARKHGKVSEREYINSAGDVVDTIEEATGARYSLGQGKNAEDFQPVKSWEEQFGTPGKLATMCAILGFHTKCGNVANTVLNDKENPGTVQAAAAEIDDFLAGANAGKWAERSGGGGGGLRYNPDTMAAAIAQVTGKSADIYVAKMATRVNAKGETVQQLPDGTWPKGAISYPAFAARVPAVKAAYDSLAGTGVTADQL